MKEVGFKIKNMDKASIPTKMVISIEVYGERILDMAEVVSNMQLRVLMKDNGAMANDKEEVCSFLVMATVIKVNGLTINSTGEE